MNSLAQWLCSSLKIILGILWFPLVSLGSMCPPFGWAEGLPAHQSPTAVFPVSDTAHNPDDHCAFHMWSWEAFAWATAPTADGGLRFLTLPTPSQLGTNERSPGERLMLGLRTVKSDSDEVDAFTQASGGALVDRQGFPLFYSVHMNETYFDFANKYYGRARYDEADPNINFPLGSAVFKASWRIVTEDPVPENVYTTKAHVPYLKNTNGTKLPGVEIDDSREPRAVTVALVGLHVVGVTVNHPEFLWATFEHKLNVPDLADPADYDSSNPVSGQSYTFYQAGTPANKSNQQVPVKVVDQDNQILEPRGNAFRQYAYGGESQDGVSEIMAINKQSQGIFSDTYWTHYKLIGTVWLQPDSLQPGQSDLASQAVGSVQLANATMETFVQGPQNNSGKPANCFMCHNTAGSKRGGFEGKNINLSHTLISPLFQSQSSDQSE